MRKLNEDQILERVARDFEVRPGGDGRGSHVMPLEAVFAAGQVFALEQAVLGLAEENLEDVEHDGDLLTASWLLKQSIEIKEAL